MPVPQLSDLRQLKPISFGSITLTQRGKVWVNAAMRGVSSDGTGDTGMPGSRLRAFFGGDEHIPPPTIVVEDDDETLCMYWECGDEAVVIRLDHTSWDFTE